MDLNQQLLQMRSHAQRAQLESWLGMQLPFDDEVLDYLLRLSKLVESEELSLLVADFCPHWPEGMQLALSASLSPQALRIPWHGAPGSKQILLEPAPVRQERREVPRSRNKGADPDRPKVKPMLPEAPRQPEVERTTKADPVAVDLQQTIKEIVQEQLVLQQRLQRSLSPKAGVQARPTSRAASPDPEAEKRQKCTSYRPREQSIQEIINQQLLLQEQLRPLAIAGEDRDVGIGVELDLPNSPPVTSESTMREFKALDHGEAPRRPVKDLSSTQETHVAGGRWPGYAEQWMHHDPGEESVELSNEENRVTEDRPATRPVRQRTRPRPPSHGHVSTGSGPIDVTVKLPDGRSSSQRCHPEATTEHLKQRLARESGVDVEILRLTFLGLKLKDHWRLVDCGIGPHDTLQASFSVASRPASHGKDQGARRRQGAGPLPCLGEPSKEDASPVQSPLESPVQSPVQSPTESAKVEDEPRWTAAVASLQRGIDSLQETVRTSQHKQQENLADCRHSLSMLQQQQQHQLKTLHFIEDQQRSLFSAAESSEMKQGLKQLQLEQKELRSRLNHLHQDLVPKGRAEVVETGRRAPEALRPASVASVTSVASPTEHRRWLILQVFRMLDRDRDGLLQQRELMGLARLMGFNFSEEDWAAEYRDLCRDMEIRPQKGFDPRSFTKLLDSEDGCPATDENLLEALISHCPDKTRATAAVELFERLDVDRDGFLSTSELRDFFGLELPLSSEGADHYGRYDLPAFHLLVSSLSLQQLSPSPLPAADVLPSPGEVSLDVTSPVDSPWAPSPSSPSTVKSVSPTPEGSSSQRASLVAQLFGALDSDGDGRCSSKDLAVAFASRYEAWPMHFRKLCSHWKVKQREGIDAQTFAEMLEDRSELGLYVDDLEAMISSLGQPSRLERRVSGTQDRSRLIDALFFYLDTNQDGLLDLTELQRLAKELQVSVQEWQELRAKPMDLDAFRGLVNDGAKCMYCDDSSLPSLLARFRRG